MLFPNTNTNKMSRLRLQFTTISLTIVILTLLIAYSQPSNAADYDGDGGGSELGSAGDGGGGASEVASGNDEIYETAVLQQDMDEHEKRQKLLEEMQEAMAELEGNADSAAPPTAATSAQPYDVSNESVNTIRTQARMDDVMTDSQEIEMMDSSTIMNGSAARAPIALPPTMLPRSLSTMIPAYVRQGKAEQFPRTISGGSVSVEEADANVSTSDYVEDEEHMNVRAQKAHKIDPIAMKLYHHSEADAEDNMLKDQQPAPPSQQPQHVAAPQPRTQQLQPNSSDDDYYEDPQDSLEKLQLHHQHKIHRPTVAPALPLTPSPPIASQPKSVSDVVEAIHRAQTNAARLPPAVPQARGAAWTTSGPLMDAAATPTTTVYGENTIDAITPNIAATTSSAMATGFDTESAAAAVAAALSTTTQTPTTAAATTAATTTTTTFTTTIRPAGKQGKQINITRGRKLLPHEQLRNYIEDAYIRMPLAVIVDPSADALEKTKALWREALRTNLNIKIVLVSLNASGIPAAYSFNNTRQFLAGLNSIKVKDGGNSFVGIVHASELVPYDSAVFISTAVIPPHTELVQDAAITLLKKRIRLYLIWYGERSASENETQEAVGGILGEVAIRSGGEVLHLVGSENSQELEGSTLTLVADAYVGTQEVDIPVDTTLSSLHVKIDAPMRTATLETPNGDINLKKLVKFKSLVLTLGADDSRLDAYVPLNKLRKATVYKLKIVPESVSDEYSVFVRAERKSDLFLDDLIKRFDAYFVKDRNAYPLNLYGSRLISLTETSPERSPATHANLRFDSNVEPKAVSAETAIIGDAEITMPKDQVETFSDNEIHSNRPNMPTNNTGVPTSIVNVDYKYNGVARGTTATLLQRDTTKIEMGLQSQLLLAPGMLGTLEFEVTNTRTEAVYHNIQVIDERRFLMRLNPQSIFLRAGEMAKVIVTVLIPNGTPQGTTDKITFTCHGGGTSSLSLNLKVVSSNAVDVQDTTAPTVSWTFGSRCDNVNALSTDCAERFWTLDITAQDWQSGILRLQSVPSGGLLYRNSYTVGSTEPLKATYIATCCEPKVALTAFDVTGNQRSYNVDVRDLVLTEASIAAIVLGALLLLLLIILLIWAIVWCCRRRQVSLDLPTYRSHSTRSME
uniref:VWA7 Ig-like domain-containing protein n=1 Tax=Zeugodacus cucurbitae TaxID=28588 RepID=A0A0A1X0V3_ZEUCU